MPAFTLPAGRAIHAASCCAASRLRSRKPVMPGVGDAVAQRLVARTLARARAARDEPAARDASRYSQITRES
jgi:hypothetical protein